MINWGSGKILLVDWFFENEMIGVVIFRGHIFAWGDRLRRLFLQGGVLLRVDLHGAL